MDELDFLLYRSGCGGHSGLREYQGQAEVEDCESMFRKPHVVKRI